MYLKKDDLSDFCIISKMKNIWSNKKKYKICYFNEKILFLMTFFLIPGIKIVYAMA
jgi:hypothetical protein